MPLTALQVAYLEAQIEETQQHIEERLDARLPSTELEGRLAAQQRMLAGYQPATAGTGS